MSHVTRSRRHSPGQPCPPIAPIAFGRGQRGLTLIELMIAVLVASLLVGFVFEIQGRMSNAFRSQTNIGSLQQGVRAANELIARDARLAGFMMPNGARVSDAFTVGLPGLTPGLVQTHPSGIGRLVPPLAVFDNPNGMPADGMEPDGVHFFYADPNPVAQAVVQRILSPTDVVVGDVATFEIGDLVLFARRNPTPIPHPLGEDFPMIVGYFACIAKLTNVDPFNAAGPVLSFAADAPFNTPSNNHCFVGAGTDLPAITDTSTDKTQVFRLIARAYRIDTTRLQIAPLERSDTGGLRDDWQEIGTGFVDLQISRRFLEMTADGVDADGDSNDRGDWYTIDPPSPATRVLSQLGIGLVARPARGLEGVRAAVIPVLTGMNYPSGNPNNNPFGNARGPKNRFRPEYNPGADMVRGGDFVYRQSMSIVDIRNLGVSY
jgi:prepilin-type N-terminal cleavage/methylation domain-containing protein